jgi:hypothetical protein
MAEIGVITGLVGLVDIFAKQSLTLYGIYKSICSAETELSSLENEIRLFRSGLGYLHSILEKRRARKRVSKEFFRTVNDFILECQAVFSQIDAAVGKSHQQYKNDTVASTNIVAGVKWHFKKPKVEELKSKLWSLMSMLQLMLTAEFSEKLLPRRFVP